MSWNHIVSMKFKNTFAILHSTSKRNVAIAIMFHFPNYSEKGATDSV